MRLRRMDDIGTASILDLAAGAGFLPQSAQSADCPLLVEGAFPLRRGWADEGIGPYKECGLDKKAKTAGFPAVF